jgi:hypothetical protein
MSAGAHIVTLALEVLEVTGVTSSFSLSGLQAFHSPDFKLFTLRTSSFSLSGLQAFFSTALKLSAVSPSSFLLLRL